MPQIHMAWMMWSPFQCTPAVRGTTLWPAWTCPVEETSPSGFSVAPLFSWRATRQLYSSHWQLILTAHSLTAHTLTHCFYCKQDVKIYKYRDILDINFSLLNFVWYFDIFFCYPSQSCDIILMFIYFACMYMHDKDLWWCLFLFYKMIQNLKQLSIKSVTKVVRCSFVSW